MNLDHLFDREPIEQFGDEFRADMNTCDPRPRLGLASIPEMREVIMKMNEAKRQEERMTHSSRRRPVAPAPSDQEKGEIVAAYRKGTPISHIGRLFGRGTRTVYCVLREAAVEIRPKGERLRAPQPGPGVALPIVVTDDDEPDIPAHLREQQIASEIAAETACEVAAEFLHPTSGLEDAVLNLPLRALLAYKPEQQAAIKLLAASFLEVARGQTA